MESRKFKCFELKTKSDLTLGQLFDPRAWALYRSHNVWGEC